MEDLEQRVDHAEKEIFRLDKESALLRQGQESIRSQLEGIHSNTKWLVRIVLGAVVLAGLNVVFNGAI